LRQFAGGMKYSKDLYTVQTRPDSIGNNVTRIRNNQFTCPVDAAEVAKCGVITQKVDGVMDALHHKSRCGRVILRDVRCLISSRLRKA